MAGMRQPATVPAGIGQATGDDMPHHSAHDRHAPGSRLNAGEWVDRARRALPALLGLALFIAGLEVLRSELSAVGWHDLTRVVFDTPTWQLAVAVVLTAANYAVLTGYDLLAFSSIGSTLSRARIVVTALLAYAIANNVGFASLSGASVRYRFYSRWGVSNADLSRVVVSYSVTFWLGLLALGGTSCLAGLPMGSGGGGLSWLAPWLPVAGTMLLGVVAAYLVATVVVRRPLRVRSVDFTLPAPGYALGQLAVSSLDWALAGAVLYVLLPAGHVAFLPFLGSYLIAILLGLFSHVPGGVGVFEGLMVLLLRPVLPAEQVVPALLVYRVLYYLLPLGMGVTGLVVDEAIQRRRVAAQVTRWFGRLSEIITPRLLSVLTFAAGLVLLFSGATPAAPGRLDLVDRLFPIGVVEASHFAGSVTGALLLVLSQGLARRLDAAYYLSSLLIAVGMTVSLVKGFDYEEAGLLLFVLVLLRHARTAFDRRAAFFDTRFSPGWLAAVIGALASSIWLGFFAFKHVEYSNELWWQFELQAEASRFLRASVGAAIVVLVAGVARLLSHPPHDAPLPTASDLDALAPIVNSQEATSANLVYLGDKALLLDDARTGFVMYGVQGRTWVAMGDPVGPDACVPDLVRRFLERCDDYGGTPVFYEVSRSQLHRYADFGLTFLKLGEEARVDLTRFSLEGGRASKLRQAARRLERDGATFRVVSPEEVPPLLPEMRAVSDDWLDEKAGAEKGFSLGFFDEDYLRRFPIALVERAGRIEAFANVWPGSGRVELSVDLMRYRRDALKGVMESLFVHMMLWGQREGYRWFSLGMAPLSGFERSPVAPLWQRLGGFLFDHGEAIYNFQGLRAYKDKFDPTWESRYLAYPGGVSLARVLADVSALVAGGYGRILLKRS